MADSVTYVFDDTGKAYAYVQGKVVAASHDLDELERKLAAPPLPPGGVGVNPGPSGGPAGPPMDDLHDDAGDAPKGMKVVFEGELRPSDGGGEPDPLPEASPDTLPGDDLPPRATHITTPNGLKGTILGKTKGLWGDQVTIRLENGRIAKFDVTDDSNLTYSTDQAQTTSPYARMASVLASDVDPTEAGMRKRLALLRTVKDEAKATFSTAAYVDESTLHNFIVEADAQMNELQQALEALQEAEPYAPPTPQVFEQESMGGNDSTWLDQTVNQMIGENEAQNFDQMMNEAPEMLVAEQPTPVLEDEQAVTDVANDFVSSHTAGLNADATRDFREAFLVRVAKCREDELAAREDDAPRQAKTAAAEDFDGPAEGLFF